MNLNLYVIEYAVLVKTPQKNNSKLRENRKKGICRAVSNLSLQFGDTNRKQKQKLFILAEIYKFINWKDCTSNYRMKLWEISHSNLGKTNKMNNQLTQF